MNQAETLLNSIAEGDTPTRTAEPATEPHIVVGTDRFITVPQELCRIAVQYDHDIETVTFDCPRYWDGIDMSQMRIYINYRRSDKYKDSYRAKNVVVDEVDPNIMHFDWTISRNVTEVKGALVFLICIKKADEDDNEVNHWNSELNTQMYISEGMECGDESMMATYPDYLARMEDEFQSSVELLMADLLAAKEAGEFDGYSPVVSVSAIAGGHRVTITDVNGSKTINVRDGDNGNDGMSPTVTVETITDGHRVTITDATGSKSFDVMNGADGTGAGDMLANRYDPQGKQTDIYQYVDNAVTAAFEGIMRAEDTSV